MTWTVAQGSSVHGDSPGRNTGVGCHALLQGIFLAWGSNPGLLHFRQILYHLSYHGSPKILEWVAYPFSRGSSQHGSQAGVSWTAGRFYSSWVTREAHKSLYSNIKLKQKLQIVLLRPSIMQQQKTHKQKRQKYFATILTKM